MRKFVIAAPPFEAGGDHVIATPPATVVSDPIAGAPGTVDGVAESSLESAPSPATLSAVTL